MDTYYFRKKWKELGKYRRRNFHYLDSSHHLYIYAGTNEKVYDAILIETINEPPELKSGESLEISKSIGKNGKWYLEISSAKHENQYVFSRMCLDLYESTRNCITEKNGMNIIKDRYNAWQKTFRTDKDILTDESIKKLIGELIFMNKYLSVNYGWTAAIESWTGTLDSERDFVLPDKWFYIKTVLKGQNRILSPEQSDTENDGCQAIAFADIATSAAPDAKSVSRIINEFRKKTEDSPETFLMFEEKLAASGYADIPAYDDIYCRYHNEEFRCESE